MYRVQTLHRTSSRARIYDALPPAREDEARRQIALSMTRHITSGLQDVVDRIAYKMQGERTHL